MEKFTVGDVILVSFPFSNLKGKKVRPALVLARVEFGNYILCQITSKPYSSKIAISMSHSDFTDGNLPLKSYARPDKIFTADPSIVIGKAGTLKLNKRKTILKRVQNLFTDTPTL